jgi:hypothetical protein
VALPEIFAVCQKAAFGPISNELANALTSRFANWLTDPLGGMGQ